MRVLVAEEIGSALLVLGIRHPRKVEKIGIELNFLRGNFEQALTRRVSDLGGGGEGKIECVQHQHASWRFGRARRCCKPLHCESQNKDPARSGRALSHRSATIALDGHVCPRPGSLLGDPMPWSNGDEYRQS